MLEDVAPSKLYSVTGATIKISTFSGANVVEESSIAGGAYNWANIFTDGVDIFGYSTTGPRALKVDIATETPVAYGMNFGSAVIGFTDDVVYAIDGTVARFFDKNLTTDLASSSVFTDATTNQWLGGYADTSVLGSNNLVTYGLISLSGFTARAMYMDSYSGSGISAELISLGNLGNETEWQTAENIFTFADQNLFMHVNTGTNTIKFGRRSPYTFAYRADLTFSGVSMNSSTQACLHAGDFYFISTTGELIKVADIQNAGATDWEQLTDVSGNIGLTTYICVR